MNISNIKDDDVIHLDNYVCILKPSVKKGIILWTNYTQPKGKPSLYHTGLKTGEQLHKEGIDFGRSIYHPYIFFRAPYYSRQIDYSSIETEIYSSYGNHKIDNKKRIYIRVDPDRTYVFSSEIRVRYIPQFRLDDPRYYQYTEREINKSRKTLTEYLEIIKKNRELKCNNNKQYKYHLFTSKKMEFPSEYNLAYPFDDADISLNSEILIPIPHMGKSFFITIT